MKFKYLAVLVFFVASAFGAARAEAILSYREQKGGFRTIEDIMKVPGIKNAAFQKIKDKITV